MLIETLKTIGFGLFVNSSYDLMHNDFSLYNIYIGLGSLCMIIGSYFLEKRRKQ